jgi:hypothetical protein
MNNSHNILTVLLNLTLDELHGNLPSSISSNEEHIALNLYIMFGFHFEK